MDKGIAVRNVPTVGSAHPVVRDRAPYPLFAPESRSQSVEDGLRPPDRQVRTEFPPGPPSSFEVPLGLVALLWVVLEKKIKSASFFFFFFFLR